MLFRSNYIHVGTDCVDQVIGVSDRRGHELSSALHVIDGQTRVPGKLLVIDPEIFRSSDEYGHVIDFKFDERHGLGGVKVQRDDQWNFLVL